MLATTFTRFGFFQRAVPHLSRGFAKEGWWKDVTLTELAKANQRDRLETLLRLEWECNEREYIENAQRLITTHYTRLKELGKPEISINF